MTDAFDRDQRISGPCTAHRNHRYSATATLAGAACANGYRTGMVTEEMVRDLGDLSGFKAYAAGPHWMVDAAGKSLVTSGLTRENIHADVFFTPALQDNERSEA